MPGVYDRAFLALKRIATGQKLTVAGNTSALSRHEMETIAREACDALGISYAPKELFKRKTMKTLVWVRNRSAKGSKDGSDPSPQIIHDMKDGLIGPKVEIVGDPVQLTPEDDGIPLRDLVAKYPAPTLAPEA